MEVGQEPRDIRSVGDHDSVMEAAGAGILLAGLDIAQSARGRGADDVRGRLEFGNDGTEGSPYAAELFDAGLDLVGHALHIDVHKREPVLAVSEDEVVLGSGDRVGLPARPGCGYDLDAIRQTVFERPIA